MSNAANNNSGGVATIVPASEPRANAGVRLPIAAGPICHLYVHIPFCARICPYCAFYKDLLDRSQTQRFCRAILCELEQHQGRATSQPRKRPGLRSRSSLSRQPLPSTIYFGGGT